MRAPCAGYCMEKIMFRKYVAAVALIWTALFLGTTEAAEWKYARKWQMTRHIQAVDFANSKVGVIAANRATVGKTTDGGLTWRAGSLNAYLPPEKKNSEFKHAFMLNETTGFVCGENGVLFKTEDGAETWMPLNVGVSPALNSVYFIDKMRGWIAADGGAAFRTEDGGATWQPLNTDTNNDLRDVYFETLMKGFIVGDAGTGLYTEDGGDTWVSQSIGNMSIKTVSAVGGRMWAVGGNGAGMRYGGNGEWASMTMNVPNSNGMPEPIWEVEFVNENLGIAGAEFGVVLKTNDGGDTWTPIEPRPTFARINDVSWLNRNTLVAVGEYGTLIRSTDAGENWDIIWSHPDLFSVQFADEKNGWATGAAGTIYATSDGGASWQLQRIDAPFQLFGLAVVSDKKSFVVGDNRTFFETTDGTSWSPLQNTRSETGQEQRIATSDGAELSLSSNAIEFMPDGNTGWLVGEVAKAIKTDDGGNTWTSYTVNAQEATFNTLYGMDIISKTNMAAVGLAGTIIRTTDGGDTWEKIDSNVFEQLNDIEFAPDGKTGWVVGTGGTILRSTDSGATWVAQISNADAVNLNAVAAVSADEAWAAGESATLLHTLDGGVTWTRTATPTRTLDINGVAAAPDGRVWAVGEWGIILVYE